MPFTVFDTPLINTLLRWISVFTLKLLGWKIIGSKPTEPRYVIVAAPHTSNWDFPFTLMVCFALNLNVHWMGKSSLFPPFIGGVMRWLGGIPVNREQAGHIVDATITAFKNASYLTVIVPPEGTRGRVSTWKTGFYRIATGAQVPIALAFLDFKTRHGGIGKLFWPTGDLSVDLPEIQAFYAGITGKHPNRFNAGTD